VDEQLDGDPIDADGFPVRCRKACEHDDDVQVAGGGGSPSSRASRKNRCKRLGELLNDYGQGHLQCVHAPHAFVARGGPKTRVAHGLTIFARCASPLCRVPGRCTTAGFRTVPGLPFSAGGLQARVIEM